ncbi:MAG: flagellar export chaperone FliS [Gammaproteobacteria bacterium]|nr:flagellar export chaperone FliS [Gammaproteobacteria bacterium]
MITSYKEYSNIELSTEIMSASGHRQIQLLIDKCLQHLQAAKIYIQEKQLTKKHEAIAKALDILIYMRSILNFKDQEAVALSTLLNTIYAASEKSVTLANLKNDVSYLDHVETALSQIKSGWDTIGQP